MHRRRSSITVSWETHWYGRSPRSGGAYEVFYYDFADQKKLKSPDVLKSALIQSEVLEKALLRSVAQSFDNYFKDSMVGAPEEVMLFRRSTDLNMKKLTSARDPAVARFYPDRVIELVEPDSTPVLHHKTAQNMSVMLDSGAVRHHGE
ncbi:MAG: hypothetical protein V8S22_03350 [Lachnospiraceae bacterium]